MSRPPARAVPSAGRGWWPVLVLAGGLLLAGSCTFDAATRWVDLGPAPQVEPPEPLCEAGAMRCTSAVEACEAGPEGERWVVVDDCAAQGLVCAPTLLQCTTCVPDKAFCEGQTTALCSSDGDTFETFETCEPSLGEACRTGVCTQLCVQAREQRSNVGCEYWAVDLDNAMIDAARNAAAQQFAVVVSNPQPDVPVDVRILQDDTQPGDAGSPVVVAQAVIAPLNLRVFKLGPREVDGSPEGSYDTGTHSALTRHAYRIDSDFPVVAYQFNPLENVNVFSNDASLLKPREAFSYGDTAMTLAYVVASWPQTIAITDDPDTNFSSTNPIHLRSFLTVVATRDNTEVIVRPTAKVIGGGAVPATAAGGLIKMTLGAFDVLNLETGAFDADFTGSTVRANGPVAVFAGGEASDAPRFDTLSQRRCCADHLEEQLDPIRAAGKTFALVHSPSRTEAVLQAGGNLGVAAEPEYVRFVATVDAITTIRTSLPEPDDVITLLHTGDYAEVTAETDFVAESDKPIHVVQIMASQDAANVPRGLPGGDPSLLVVPPIEQFRRDYVFLTPDKYAFDFITVAAPAGAEIRLDDAPLDSQLCNLAPADGLTDEERGGPPAYIAYRCQLSFATVDPETGAILPGQQNDGVHRIVADSPIGVAVFGFDAFVSYAYAAGTELRDIAPPQ